MKTSTILLVALVVAAIPALNATPSSQSEKDHSYRKIPIPKKDYGYQFLKTRVIQTQQERKALLKMVKGKSWNNSKAFQEGIEKGKVDFEKEVLLLIPHVENSGSNVVTFEKPSRDGKTLQCRISRKPTEFGTEDMAYYCFALVVRKSLIETIEIRVGKQKTRKIKLK